MSYFEETKNETLKPENTISEDVDLLRIFEGKDDLLDMLGKDKDFYEV